MFTKITKWIWFISSYMPLYFLLIIYNLNIVPGENIIFLDALKKAWNENLLFNSVMLILCLLSVGFLFLILHIKSNETKECTVNQVKNGNIDVLNYFITYLFPIITMDITSINSVICNFIIFIIIGMFYLQSDQLHWNPTLAFLGIKIYNINEDFILTKKDGDQLNSYIASNNQIFVHKICPGIYLEKERKATNCA